MNTWIALLRGINVGGHKKVRMAELRELCTSLGLAAVSTYIQSGNVVFRVGGGRAQVAGKLRRGIEEKFGFDIPVVVRTLEEMAAVVDGNPFLAEDVEDTSKLHVTFLEGEPQPAAREGFAHYRIGPDEVRLVGTEAYLHCPQGLARTKLTPTFLERSFGTPSTTRNWRTVTTLLEQARGA